MWVAVTRQVVVIMAVTMVCDCGRRKACNYCDLVVMGCMAVVPISLGCGYG
jgi:hypothetical protein